MNLCAVVTARTQTVGGHGARQQSVEKARESIVVLAGEDKDGQPIAPGLGFFIGENLIATDDRVVRSAVSIHVKVKIAGQEWKQLEVMSRDSYRFATILTLRTNQSVRVTPLTLGDSDTVSLEDKVCLLSGPGPDDAVSDGTVRRIARFNYTRDIQTPGPYFQITAPMLASHTGGPVFNSNGEVIGIAAQSPDGQSLGFAIPTSYLRTLLSYRNIEVSADNPESLAADKSSDSAGGAGREPSTGGALPVNKKPVLLNSPRPRYTEEARQNQTQGVVNARVLIDRNGNVARVRITKGLPNGLIEQAIEAVFQMKFTPAMRSDLAVSYWQAMLVEFNLR